MSVVLINDSIEAGAGNDTITFVNVGDTIDGGTGNDTLKIDDTYSSSSDIDDALVNVEVIQATATTGATLAVDLSI